MKKVILVGNLYIGGACMVMGILANDMFGVAAGLGGLVCGIIGVEQVSEKH